MSLQWRRKLLLLKAEAVYGTDPVPAVDDFVLATDVRLTPLVGDTVQRGIEQPYYANEGVLQVATHCALEFSVELAASGAAGTAPQWGTCLKPCAMKETVTANTSVVYEPKTDATDSATIYLNIAGILQKLTGCRGSWSVEIASNQIPRIKFSVLGNYNKPTAVALPVNLAAYAADIAKWKKPLVPNKTATPTALWKGRKLALTSLAYDHANEVIHRELIGVAPTNDISGRTPAGSMTIDTQAVTNDVNWVDESRASTTAALQIVHGTVAGSVVTIDCPQVEIQPMSYGDDRGVWTSQIPIAYKPNTGDDEIKITLT